MNEYWRDRVAIISGSSRGIGKRIALRLLEYGARVVLNGRDEIRLDRVRIEFRNRGFDPLCVAADVSSYDDCERIVRATVREYGRLDLVVNNAAMSLRGTVEETDPQWIERIVAINILGCFFLSRAAIPELRKRRGHIHFHSSVSAFLGLPEYSVYCATKAALGPLAQSLRSELAGDGIGVSLTWIGFTENDEDKQYYDRSGRSITLAKRAGVPLMESGRVATRILRDIRRGKHTAVYTPLGKLVALLNRFSPALLESLFGFVRRRTRM